MEVRNWTNSEYHAGSRFNRVFYRHVLMTLATIVAFAIGNAQAQNKIIDPSKVAPEHRAAAEKRAAEQKKVAFCQKQADEQNVLPRDRLQVVIACIEK